MLKTITKSAIVGSTLGFFKNLTSRKQESHVAASLGLVALGVVVGASAGLLLAPKSGTELRSDMRLKAKQLQSRAGEQLSRVRNSNRVAETNV